MERLTWDAIEERFADEWVLIADVEMDDVMNIISGEVVVHGTDKDEVVREIVERHKQRVNGSAFLYVGEPSDEYAYVL